jgi:Ca2+-binding RTX toxin-like protein
VHLGCGRWSLPEMAQMTEPVNARQRPRCTTHLDQNNGACVNRAIGITAATVMLAALGFATSPAQAVDKTCFGQAATIVGTANDDTLTGTEGPDVIVGLGGGDTIDGLGGDDLICAGDNVASFVPGPQGKEAGHLDVVHGGSGNDRIDGGLGLEFLNGDDGDDDIYTGGRLRRKDIAVGGEEASGGPGDDRMYSAAVGPDGAPVFSKPGDALSNGDDFNVLVAFHGDERNDHLVGNDSDEILLGDSGDDVISAHGGLDQISGNGGNDRIYGGRGPDTILGNGGNDLIIGGPGNDDLQGNKGDDVLFGRTGRDEISGGYGIDECHSPNHGPGCNHIAVPSAG